MAGWVVSAIRAPCSLTMTLQTKILLVISFTFVALISVLYAASQAIVLGSFSEQEVQDATQNVDRVKSALADNLTALEGTARDWSLWDDTYTYIEDHNRAYFDSNLAGNTPMESNRLSLMLFIDSNGQVVFQKSFNYQEGIELIAPPGLQEQSNPTAPSCITQAVRAVSPASSHYLTRRC